MTSDNIVICFPVRGQSVNSPDKWYCHEMTPDGQTLPGFLSDSDISGGHNDPI